MFGNPGGRYVDPRLGLSQHLLKQGTNSGPIQHWTQGAGRLAQALSGAYLQKQIMGDQQGALSAMSQGASAKPWVDPDTGQVAPNQGPVGGREGAQYALSKQEGNPYAGHLSSQLAMQAIGRDDKMSDYNMARQHGMEDFETKLGIKAKYPTPTSQMSNFTMAQNDPAFAEFLKATGSDSTPKSIQEWNAFQKMTREEQNQYLLMKRSNPYLNIGGEMVQQIGRAHV